MINDGVISGEVDWWRILVFFFNDTATTEIYTLSLHDALPIYTSGRFKDFLLESGI